MLKDWYNKVVSKVCGWFGYYTIDHVNNVAQLLAMEVDDLNNQVHVLLYAMGDLEKRHKDMNLIIMSLMTFLGQTETEIKLEFLQGLYDNKYILDADNDKDGNVLLKMTQNLEKDTNGN